MRSLQKGPAVKQKSDSKKQVPRAPKTAQKDKRERGTGRKAWMSLEKWQTQVVPGQAHSNFPSAQKGERNKNNNRKTGLNNINDGHCKSRPLRDVSCYRQHCRTNPELKFNVCCPLVPARRALKGALRGPIPRVETSGQQGVRKKPMPTKRERKKVSKCATTVHPASNPLQKRNNAKTNVVQNENTKKNKEKTNHGCFVRGTKTKRKICKVLSEDENTIKEVHRKMYIREYRPTKSGRIPRREKRKSGVPKITSGLKGTARPSTGTGGIKSSLSNINPKGKRARLQASPYPSVHTLDEQRALYNLITATTPSASGISYQTLLANGKSSTSVPVHEETLSLCPPQMATVANQQEMGHAKDNVPMKSFKIPLKSKVPAIAIKKRKSNERVIQSKKKKSKEGVIRRNKKARPRKSRHIKSNIVRSTLTKPNVVASEKILSKTWPINVEVSSMCSPGHPLSSNARVDEASSDKNKEDQIAQPPGRQMATQEKNASSVCTVNSSDRPASACSTQSCHESQRYGHQRTISSSNTRPFEKNQYPTMRPLSALTGVDSTYASRNIMYKSERVHHFQSPSNWPSTSQCFRNSNFTPNNSCKYSSSWSIIPSMSLKENNNFQKSQPPQMFVSRNAGDPLQETRAFDASLQQRSAYNGQYMNNTPTFAYPGQWPMPRGSQSNLDLSSHGLTQEVHHLHARMLTDLRRPRHIDLRRVNPPWETHCMQFKDSIRESNDKTLKAIFKRLDPTASPFF